MVTRLKEITFVFENCDSITIDGKYVGYFLVDDIRTYFARMAINHVGKGETAETFAIEIHKDANKERCEFGIKEYKQMTFDRFKGCDITSIQFTLEEQYVEEGKIPHTESYDYYVSWTSDSDYNNNAQSNYISKDDNLYVVISKDKKIEDFFDLEEIDDSDYADFHFCMLDVGDEYSDR